MKLLFVKRRNDFMELKEKLIKLRKDKGLTQFQLAALIGVTGRSVQNYELGSRYPKREILQKLCEVFDVPLEYLVSNRDIFEPDAEVNTELDSKLSAQQFLDNASSLFAGGEMSEDDKDKIMLALQKIYWKAKEKSIKDAATNKNNSKQ
jgi:transcriptional regulator with XRE-family HTH domain